MRHPGAGIAMLTLGLLAGCEVERVPEKGVSATTRRDSSSAVPVASPERPMALRREGQGLLDSARVAIIDGRAELAATWLLQAASFFVTQAHTPPSGGTDDLLAAARGLDSLARDVRQRRIADSSRLDRLSAHANLAEAERHAALASVAWGTRNKESVSDELTMAADHIERAALDGRMTLAPAMRSVLVALRATVRDLSARRVGDLRDLDDPLGSLRLEIQAMHQRLERAPSRL